MATYNDHRHTRRGSFGLVVRDLAPERDDADDRLILTAAHLFDGHDNDARVAYCDPGPEPAPASGDQAVKHCGVLRRRVPLHHIPTIAVDAAVIKPVHGLKCTNRSSQGGIRGIRDLWIEDDKTNVIVRKLGAQTGTTTGTLKPVAADLRVKDQRVRYSMGWWIYGQDAFASRGDSGAIVLDEERYVVGMLVAVEHEGNGKAEPAGAFVHGIKQIFEALCIELPAA